MRRHNFLLLPAAVLLVAIQPMLASTVQVGHCIPNVQSYPTISAAVSGVTAGSTVEVCPGGYAEQVTITQPLTLIGLRVGTANQAVIRRTTQPPLKHRPGPERPSLSLSWRHALQIPQRAENWQARDPLDICGRVQASIG